MAAAVGRHAAPDDAGTDPLVAAALAQLPTGASGTRHARIGDRSSGEASVTELPVTGLPVGEGTESGLGWPGDTTTGGGLGWPGSTDAADATARMDAVPPVPSSQPEEEPEPPTPRGWRRLFGAA